MKIKSEEIVWHKPKEKKPEEGRTILQAFEGSHHLVTGTYEVINGKEYWTDDTYDADTREPAAWAYITNPINRGD